MDRSAVFMVRLTKPSASRITIDYATVAGTASPGIDYTPVSGTLVFEPGDVVRQIMVPVRGAIPGNLDEAFTVVLSNPSNVILSDNTGLCTIPGTPPTYEPIFSIDDITVTG